MFAREYFDRFAPLYLETRPHLADRLVNPYYAGQVALALSAARIPLPSIALPLRFNLPNDPVVTERYPEELENAVVFHYLREDQFDRQQIFRWRETYSVFLARPLNPANARFRDSVRTLFGEEYPFDHPPEPQDRPETHETRPSVRRADQGAASASLTAEQALLASFRETGALEPLMKAKQSLVARFGVEDGWRRYKDLLGLPPTARIRYATLAGQGEYARRHGTRFVETFAGGTPFRVEALPVLDGATSPAIISRARSTHLACLEDVYVREASAAIVTDHHALLDFEDAELDMFDCEFDIDPSFFSASRHSAWVVTAEDDPTCLQIDEAFSLLGPQLGAFGDFMMQYLPRYLWADMSGELPHVPVLSSTQASADHSRRHPTRRPRRCGDHRGRSLAACPPGPALVWLEHHLRTGAGGHGRAVLDSAQLSVPGTDGAGRVRAQPARGPACRARYRAGERLPRPPAVALGTTGERFRDRGRRRRAGLYGRLSG